MGVETPIPPIMIYAAAPGGAPPRRINNQKHFGKHRNCPAVPREGPGGGEPSYLRFSWLRCEPNKVHTRFYRTEPFFRSEFWNNIRTLFLLLFPLRAGVKMALCPGFFLLSSGVFSDSSSPARGHGPGGAIRFIFPLTSY